MPPRCQSIASTVQLLTPLLPPSLHASISPPIQPACLCLHCPACYSPQHSPCLHVRHHGPKNTTGTAATWLKPRAGCLRGRRVHWHGVRGRAGAQWLGRDCRVPRGQVGPACGARPPRQCPAEPRRVSPTAQPTLPRRVERHGAGFCTSCMRLRWYLPVGCGASAGVCCRLMSRLFTPEIAAFYESFYAGKAVSTLAVRAVPCEAKRMADVSQPVLHCCV